MADLAEDILTECRATGEPFIVSFEPADVDAEINAPVGCDPPQKPSPFSTEHLSAYQLWKTHEKKRQLRKDYLDYWMRSAQNTGTGRPIDGLISPVAPFAAPPHAKNK
jgi:amidase